MTFDLWLPPSPEVHMNVLSVTDDDQNKNIGPGLRLWLNKKDMISSSVKSKTKGYIMDTPSDLTSNMFSNEGLIK